MARVLSSLESDALYHSLVDEDAAGDVAFFLYATVAYCAVRVATEFIVPGKIRGYTRQQYVVTLGHQAVLLPCLGIGWALGFLVREGSSFIYLLTGAYMLSDSIVNYSPVSGCVAAFNDTERPTFSYSVHVHHVFTVRLCALGTTLPSWLEDEGAVCILIGEAGSLWITVTLLWPTALNYILRFYTFLASRAMGVLLALDIARQLQSTAPRVLLLLGALGIAHDNWVGAQPPRCPTPTPVLLRRTQRAAYCLSPVCCSARSARCAPTPRLPPRLARCPRRAPGRCEQSLAVSPFRTGTEGLRTSQ